MSDYFKKCQFIRNLFIRLIDFYYFTIWLITFNSYFIFIFRFHSSENSKVTNKSGFDKRYRTSQTSQQRCLRNQFSIDLFTFRFVFPVNTALVSSCPVTFFDMTHRSSVNSCNLNRQPYSVIMSCMTAVIPELGVAWWDCARLTTGRITTGRVTRHQPGFSSFGLPAEACSRYACKPVKSMGSPWASENIWQHGAWSVESAAETSSS